MESALNSYIELHRDLKQKAKQVPKTQFFRPNSAATISNSTPSTSNSTPSTTNSTPSTSNSTPSTSNSTPSTINSTPSTSPSTPSTSKPSPKPPTTTSKREEVSLKWLMGTRVTRMGPLSLGFLKKTRLGASRQMEKRRLLEKLMDWLYKMEWNLMLAKTLVVHMEFVSLPLLRSQTAWYPPGSLGWTPWLPVLA
uniref:Uncharacterized protein n=1 Tax=Eptatretus burgeri TaxID=7764 RepID=A0A8C4PZQ3_EPTBU